MIIIDEGHDVFTVEKQANEACLYIKIGGYTVYIDDSMLETDGLIVQSWRDGDHINEPSNH